MRFRVLMSAAAWTAFACASAPVSTECQESELVIGVEAHPAVASVVSSYVVTATRDGVAVARRSVDVADGRPLFPFEVPVARDVASSSALSVRIEAFELSIGATGERAPVSVVTRLAVAPFACGEKMLVRLPLEAQCVTFGSLGVLGPSCNLPQTCSSGRCIDSTLLAGDLEPYRSDWAENTADACSNLSGGEPDLIVGTGQTDFAPLAEGQTLAAQPGPQGGHHLWIAFRAKQLKQAGATITLTARQPETSVTVPATSFVFSLFPDEGGYCKIYGLRYQLDNASNPVSAFLGKPLDVTVEVRDKQGRSAKRTQRIRVADALMPVQ
jgi:hypothetical protein